MKFTFNYELIQQHWSNYIKLKQNKTNKHSEIFNNSSGGSLNGVVMHKKIQQHLSTVAIDHVN